VKPTRYICALLTTFVAFACSEETPTSIETEGLSSSGPAETASAVMATPVGADHRFLSLAQQIPGFAGYYYTGSEGILVVRVTSGESQEQVITSVLSSLDPVRRDETSDVMLLPAEFSFRELYSWRTDLDHVLNLPQVVYTDVDEVRNRVVVGIEEPAVRATIQAEAARLSIPEGALIVEEVQRPSRLTTAGSPLLSLTSEVRPLIGGLDINTGSNGCTLGFIANRSVDRVFLTNGHCTFEFGGTEDTPFGQPTLSEFVGRELIDPFFFGGLPGCPVGVFCRWSDAAAVKVQTSSTIGHIAKTACANCIGTTIQDTFRVLFETSEPVVGEVLNKVGASTGWTQGTVSETCLHFFVEADEDPGTLEKLLCQDRVTGAGVASGDSGAPVFRLIGTRTVSLYGLVWGGRSNEFVFSAMSNIEQEVGNLVTEVELGPGEP